MMTKKYKSKICPPESLRIEYARCHMTDRGYQVVELTHMPTKERVVCIGDEGSIKVYNRALGELEEKVYWRCKDE